MQINSHLSVLIPDLAKKRCGVMAALLSLGIAAQAQTVSFTYDSAGGVTSRVVKDVSKKIQALTENAETTEQTTETSDVLKVKVTPYPKLGSELTIDCSCPKQEVSKLSYTLANTFGQVYLQGNLSDGVNQVNTSQLPPGIYLLKVACTEHAKSFRLIKE